MGMSKKIWPAITFELCIPDLNQGFWTFFYSHTTDIFFQLGTLYLFIADFFATKIIGGAKELVVHLLLSGNI